MRYRKNRRMKDLLAWLEKRGYKTKVLHPKGALSVYGTNRRIGGELFLTIGSSTIKMITKSGFRVADMSYDGGRKKIRMTVISNDF